MFGAYAQDAPGLAAGGVLQQVHRRRAYEAGDEGGGRLVIDLLGRAELLHVAGVHDDHALRQGHGLDLVVRHEQAGDAQFGVQLLDLDARLAAQLGVDPDRPLVVITGGSLGAVNVNRAVAASAKDLLAHAQVIHLTGKGKDDEVRSLVSVSAGEDVLGELGPDHVSDGDYRVAPYLERIDLAFACADLIICRSGAGTVSELTALGLPAIYVPLPIGNGEQRFNAQPVVDAEGGLMVADGDFTPDWVRGHVPELLADPDKLSRYGANAWKYGIRDAAEVMAKRVLALIDQPAD